MSDRYYIIETAGYTIPPPHHHARTYTGRKTASLAVLDRLDCHREVREWTAGLRGGFNVRQAREAARKLCDRLNEREWEAQAS